MHRRVDCRVKCSARGHDRHLFGDITDTFFAGQVDRCDLVSAETDAVLAIGGQRPDGDAFAAEGLRHLPELALEADIGLAGGDRAHGLARIVRHLRRASRQSARARPIAARRHLLVERRMWPFQIVQRDETTPIGPRSARSFTLGIRGQGAPFILMR